MAAKKAPTNALPLMMDNDQTPSATITYANEVVAIIAGLAAAEVEGIAGMCNISQNILNKNRNVTRGVKVEIGTEEVAVDLYVIVEYGTPIQRAAMDAQESVRKAIESMTGLHVVRVDVHVQSVSFEKENKALQAGAASAALEAGVIDREEEMHVPEKPAKPAELKKDIPAEKPAKPTELKKDMPVEKPEKKEPEKKPEPKAKEAPEPKTEKASQTSSKEAETAEAGDTTPEKQEEKPAVAVKKKAPRTRKETPVETKEKDEASTEP